MVYILHGPLVASKQFQLRTRPIRSRLTIALGIRANLLTNLISLLPQSRRDSLDEINNKSTSRGQVPVSMPRIDDPPGVAAQRMVTLARNFCPE